MAIVPENRRLFAPMTVLENLKMGAYLHGGGRKEDFERVYSLFPLLHERRSQLAGTLSGGEQQMVAMGRALMARPKLLLMDEPSMGLAPILVERSFDIIKEVHEAGVAILVVEQNANVSLSIADRGYVLSTGRVVLEGKAADLLQNEELRRHTLAADASAAAGRPGTVPGRCRTDVSQGQSLGTAADPAEGLSLGHACMTRPTSTRFRSAAGIAFRSSRGACTSTRARRARCRTPCATPTSTTSATGTRRARRGSTGSSAPKPPAPRSRG